MVRAPRAGFLMMNRERREKREKISFRDFRDFRGSVNDNHSRNYLCSSVFICGSFGRWHYTWDGENRLVAMEAKANVPSAAKLKLAFIYDYQGRRIEKKVYPWNGLAYATNPSNVTRFLYDGWNMVAELDGNNNNVVTRSYLWGLDVSGSRQGAGGIGGLLAMTDHTASPVKTYAYTYDGNGNVVDVVAQNGDVAAHYEYSPFGELITATGSLAMENPFQFSTKYMDDETGLVYYGYRYYNSSTGRWINRDPIEEYGGINLYGMVENDPINWIDPLGLAKPTREGGASQLRAAVDKLKAICDKCDCVDSSKKEACKNSAEHIVEKLVSLWENEYGRGPYTHPHTVGGYYCWDWASGFVATTNTYSTGIWSATYRRFDKNGGGGVHYAARISIKNPTKSGASCEINVDDGAFGDGVVHDSDWPNKDNGYTENTNYQNPMQPNTNATPPEIPIRPQLPRI